MNQSRSLPNAALLHLVSGLALACAIAAVPVGAWGQAVVQTVPASDPMNLNAALARLGRNPRDMQALIDAGQAALAIGDVDAAVGFFSRADQVAPGNAQVRLGLARALVLNGNPYDAFALFDEAERGGALDAAATLDRGLAYDLVADNAAAQRYYKQALAAGPNDEATRRLAISQAISGDKRGSGATISPLLSRQDKAAWRARAFALAILGQTEDAVAVVNGTLPASLAAGIAPYLRYMPRLTPAQQAAVANFGQFPRASEIGQDDPRVARYATTSSSRRVTVASADAGLIPKGEPLGRSARARDRDVARDANRSKDTDVVRQIPPSATTAAAFPAFARNTPSPPPSAPQPTRQTTPAPAATVAATAPARPVPAAVATPVVQPVPAAPAPRPVVAAAQPPIPAPVAPPPVRIAVSPPPPPPSPPPPAVRTTQPPAPPVPPTPRRMSLAEAFSDLAGPAPDVTPAAGAVDIRRIRPTRVPAPGAAAPAPVVPSHPSRIWVQLATGRDRSALAYDWRRMAQKAEALFKNRRPAISSWGQTNRLLAGPFESEAAASSFMTQLRRASIDGAFQWTSPAGQVVDAIGGR